MKRRLPLHAALLSAALIFAVHAGPAAADEDGARAAIDRLLVSLGGDAGDETTSSPDWGILAGPFYTPETSFGLGIALVGLYRPGQEDADTPLSSLTLSGFASVTGTFGFNLDSYNYFNDDRQRLFVHGDIVNQPTRYWGIGYVAGRDDLAQDYTAKSVDVWPQFYQRVLPDVWIGIGWSIAQLHASALEDGDANAINATADGPSVFSSGASVHLLNDTRDFIPNPSRGHVLAIDYAAYRPAFAGDDAFDALTATFGGYLAVGSKTTLAFDLHGDFRYGEVPWNQLASLGGDKRMRGYYDGRYRDRDAVSTQIEWRRQLEWRHGIALWAGAGSLASHPTGLGAHLLPSFGAGYRFMFKPRVNVRFDLGVGRNSAGFYFQVGEAY